MVALSEAHVALFKREQIIKFQSIPAHPLGSGKTSPGGYHCSGVLKKDEKSARLGREVALPAAGTVHAKVWTPERTRIMC